MNIQKKVNSKGNKDFKYALDTQQMINSGLNLGCHISNLHPKMKPYIKFIKNEFSIIDLEIINKSFINTLKFIKEMSVQGKILLLVGTRPQDREIVQEIAIDCNLPFVNQKWIPGLFTNFKVVLEAVDRLEKLKESIQQNNKLEKKDQSLLFNDKKQEEKEKTDKCYLSKKEILQVKKKIEKLEKKIQGIKEMKKLPTAVFVLDCDREKITVQEAKKMGIKVISIVNTNVDPKIPDYVIFGNNRSIVSLRYILEQIKKIIKENQNTLNYKSKASNSK